MVEINLNYTGLLSMSSVHQILSNFVPFVSMYGKSVFYSLPRQDRRTWSLPQSYCVFKGNHFNRKKFGYHVSYADKIPMSILYTTG